ncbi:MAG TPA: RNA-binding protein [Cyanobacteria bacterium UBA11372]|nr:RNA-binding protein [Cyanobacteria bacterium UBA11372]
MSILASLIQKHIKQVVAIALLFSLFWFSRLPGLSATERAAIASRFSFAILPLPELAGGTPKFERSVHPSLERHKGWISAVGASVALNDLDGDGLSNDVCYVDPRSDRVIITPVPGLGDRYQPFALQPSARLYDSSTMAPMGCLPGDLNEDGLMDILVYYWGRTPVAFIHVEGLKSLLQTSVYVEQEIVPGQERWYTNAATFSDLDGDGHADLIIGNYFQDNAQILNVNASGVESMQHSMTRADNGGRNRLLLWTKATTGKEPTVQFKEAKGVLDESIARAWTLAVGAADLDGDFLPELYFANDFGPDRLLHNLSKPGELQFALLEGKKTLTTPNSKVLGHDSFKGMGVDFGDVNGDGLFDIYVSNIAAEYALEESHFLFVSTGEINKMGKGIAPYIDRSETLGVSRSGWGWETKFGDFDNDGSLEALQATGFLKGEVNRWPELHELAIGNDELLSHPQSWPRFQRGDDLSGHQHNPFFIRASDGRYYDFAKELGLDEPDVTRGIATADVDGDGDLDFAIANQWENSYFYRNESPQTGAFLGLRLLRSLNQPLQKINSKTGETPIPQELLERFNYSTLGSPAIGATATVHLPDGRKLVAQVDGGNGHSGARSLELHFGLGNLESNTPLPVDLRWRDTQGQVHQESLFLSPGWHTVLLGDSAKPSPSLS